ncbi:MAG: thioredoxin family protein [Atopobiaceae bacterium]
MTSMRDLRAGESVDDFVRAHPLALVQFGSGECNPCAAIRQKVDRWLRAWDEGEVSGEGDTDQPHPAVAALYVPMEKNLELAAQMGVLSVPTVRLYVDGHLALEGAGHFSLDAILERARQYAELMA